MNILQFVCVKLTIFLSFGIIIGYYWMPSSSVALSIVLILLLLTGWLLIRRDHSFGQAAMLLSSALGIFIIAFHLDFTYREQLNADDLLKAHLWRITIREEMQQTDHYQRFIGEVSSVDGIGSGGKILCRLPLEKSEVELSVDDEILVWSRAREIRGPQNPHQFNYRNYLQKSGMYHQMNLDRERILTTDKSSPTLAGIMASLRMQVDRMMSPRDFGSNEWSVIQAIILGQRDDISDTLYEQYKRSGAIHILAVSGLHIGILILIVQLLLKPFDLLPRMRIIKMIITVMVLWTYAVLAGFSASAIRAVTMFSFLAYAQYLNRPGTSFNILALSASFILIFIDPLMLFQPGFQLSYAAVFSIVWLYPKLQRLWSPSNWVSLKIWQLISVSLAAQAGILPISLYYFHQFPVLFLVSNLLIIPFLGLILGMGFLLIILALLNILPDLLVHIYDAVIATMNAIIRWVSERDLSIENIYFDEGHLFLLTALIISVVRVLDRPAGKRVMISFALLLGLQCWDLITSLEKLLTKQLTIAHTYANTMLVYQSGNQARIWYRHMPDKKYLLRNFITGERLSHVSYDSLANTYFVNKKRLLILDEELIVDHKDFSFDIVLLTASPKINLNRFLELHRPELVIADGSNYYSDIHRWQRSCNRLGIAFHNTGTDGAYILDLSKSAHSVHQSFQEWIQ